MVDGKGQQNASRKPKLPMTFRCISHRDGMNFWLDQFLFFVHKFESSHKFTGGLEILIMIVSTAAVED